MGTTLRGAWDARACSSAQQMSQPPAALPLQAEAVQSSARSKKLQVCVKYQARGLRITSSDSSFSCRLEIGANTRKGADPHYNANLLQLPVGAE